MSNIYNKIVSWKTRGHKAIAMLIDPDKYCRTTLESLMWENILPDLILVGGSLVMSDTESVVQDIRRATEGKVPILLFPGDYSQLTGKADAVLMLSLVSGRNAEYLIGQHVKAAPKIKQLGIEAIPTGYVLIEGGVTTSVEYISNTKPLPYDKPDILSATVMASEMMGMKMIYLEAGSGATKAVSRKMIETAHQVLNIPIIVGGGLRSVEAITTAFEAGADLVVVGTAIEQNPLLAKQIMSMTRV